MQQRLLQVLALLSRREHVPRERLSHRKGRNPPQLVVQHTWRAYSSRAARAAGAAFAAFAARESMSHRHPRARHVIGQLEHSGRRPDHRARKPLANADGKAARTATARSHVRLLHEAHGTVEHPPAESSRSLQEHATTAPLGRRAAHLMGKAISGAQRPSVVISGGAPALVGRRRAAHLMGKAISMQSSVVISGTPALVGRRPRRSPSGPLRKTSWPSPAALDLSSSAETRPSYPPDAPARASRRVRT